MGASIAIDVPKGPATGRPPGRKRLARYGLPALGLLLLVVLLAGTKAAQIGQIIAGGKRAQMAGPPPEAVGTFVAQAQSWDETLPSVGSVAAARGVSIGNDTAGLVSRIAFESGMSVQRGQVLVELDTRVERAQLASARARQQLASTNLTRTRALVASGSLAPSQLDSDEAQLTGAAADASALAAQIERKTVRAPFAGKLGIRLVNVGQYLSPGTPIAVLESSEATYVDFDLPQQDQGLLTLGMPVRFTLEARDGTPPRSSEGAVAAIEPDVDPTTRNLRVRASVPPGDARLRPGMYLNVAVVLPQQTAVVAIPVTAVLHASYGDSVFVVENGETGKAARQQFVRLGQTRGDFVAVTDGVTSGQEVVSAGAFKLRNGMRVAIDNTVGPRPELSPHPVNR